jgi:uncharacterized protein YpbB
MGMIFLNNEDISIKSIVKRWITKQPREDVKTKLENLIEEHFYKVLDWIAQFE